ncbi:hypothetical protein Poly51_10440 [Rubripirellula tenax]|uniref:LTD domain-containing protein n=1 Tax=Rubripirellula tenax TaxID=2528015 RepID=A0A5C6FJI4_9BACT|nr:lamin tail domain-containing protein [Rubripirellula tenax]TWU60763.1 hypothetical protein Poly51_10440 [Rubripirellula tenax]
MSFFPMDVRYGGRWLRSFRSDYDLKTLVADQISETAGMTFVQKPAPSHHFALVAPIALIGQAKKYAVEHPAATRSQVVESSCEEICAPIECVAGSLPTLPRLGSSNQDHSAFARTDCVEMVDASDPIRWLHATWLPRQNGEATDWNAAFWFDTFDEDAASAWSDVYTVDASAPGFVNLRLLMMPSIVRWSLVMSDATSCTYVDRTPDCRQRWESPFPIGQSITTPMRPTSQSLRIKSLRNRGSSQVGEGRDSATDSSFGSLQSIELRNVGRNSISLAGVSLVDGVTFHFNDSNVSCLGPGETVTVVRNLSKVRRRTGQGVSIAGEFRVTSMTTGLPGDATITVIGDDGSVIDSLSIDPASKKWKRIATAARNHDTLSLVRVKREPVIKRTRNASKPIRERSVSIRMESHARVVKRGVVYADAPAALGQDVVAVNVVGLLPGRVATSKNYTNYVRGINGIFVDVARMPDLNVSFDDFRFLVGNSSELRDWRDAPVPSSIRIIERGGEDQSHRIIVTWADHAITNEWLQVTMRASPKTGLFADDVFYLGNQTLERSSAVSDQHSLSIRPASRKLAMLRMPPAIPCVVNAMATLKTG